MKFQKKDNDAFFTSSGWIPVSDGTWVKDPEVEFDSSTDDEQTE